MCYLQNEYSSSVERHTLAYQKVRGSILSQAMLTFGCHVRIYTSFYTESRGENTS